MLIFLVGCTTENNDTPDDNSTSNGGFTQGDIYMIRGEYEEALEFFDETLKDNPENSEAWNNRGLALFFLERYDKALEDFYKAFELDQDDTTPLMNIAHIHWKQDRYDEAIKSFDKALEVNPGEAEAWYYIGSILEFDLHDNEDALRAYNKAIDIYPDYEDSWGRKSQVLNSLGRYDEALDAIEYTIQLNPNDWLIWNRRANILNRLNRSEEALDSIDKALEIDSRIGIIWLEKTNILMKLGRYDEALESCEKALEWNTSSLNVEFKGEAVYWSAVYGKIGELLLISKNYSDAVFNFDKALEYNPNDEIVYREMALANLSEIKREEDFRQLNESLPFKTNNKLDTYEISVAPYVSNTSTFFAFGTTGSTALPGYSFAPHNEGKAFGTRRFNLYNLDETIYFYNQARGVNHHNKMNVSYLGELIGPTGDVVYYWSETFNISTEDPNLAYWHWMNISSNALTGMYTVRIRSYDLTGEKSETDNEDFYVIENVSTVNSKTPLLDSSLPETNGKLFATKPNIAKSVTGDRNYELQLDNPFQKGDTAYFYIEAYRVSWVNGVNIMVMGEVIDPIGNVVDYWEKPIIKYTDSPTGYLKNWKQAHWHDFHIPSNASEGKYLVRIGIFDNYVDYSQTTGNYFYVE